MSKEDMKESYTKYKEKVVSLLDKCRTWSENGVWKATSARLAHILPVEYVDDPNINRENKAEVIKKYVGLDCKRCLGYRLKGLHQFAHHLTSSQQLCMKFFSELIDDERKATVEMVEFIKRAFGIDIKIGAECRFEYTERNDDAYKFDVDKDGNLLKGRVYEGTSFDFHINDGTVEIYFEIKFTEQGFKKEKGDKRHLAKAEQYRNIAPEFLRNIVKTPGEFLQQYQIYRNVIRAKDNNKYIVFITDGNNPATKQDIEDVEGLLPQNVMFKTWQQIIEFYPFKLPFQLKAIQDYNKEESSF